MDVTIGSALRQWPNVVYVAAALVLAALAAHGSSLPVLGVAGAAFVAIAFVMAVFQILGKVPLPPGGSLVFGGLLLAAGVGLWILYGVSKGDPLLVYAAVVSYLGAGWIVLGWRDHISAEESDGTAGFWAAVPGPLLLVGGVVLVMVGLLRLPGWGKAPYLIGAGAAVMLPVGLNLATESALALVRVRSQGFRTRAMAAGVLVALVVVVFFWVGHAPRTSLVVTVAILVVVACIVCRGHLDTAGALTVVAFITAAPLETSAADVPAPGVGAHALVALGDSYMSGEGAPKFYTGTDDAGGDECRRAPTSYAAIVGTSSTFDGFTFLACSGAIADNLLETTAVSPDEQYSGQGSQIGELEALLRKDPSFKPALVIVTVGGNDAGFSELGEACIAPGRCNKVSDLFERRLPQVEHSDELVFGELHELLPQTAILAVPYPMPITGRPTCQEVPLTYDERIFVRRFLAGLDRAVAQAASATGTYYLSDMENALLEKHLQLCDPANHNEPGINFVKLAGVALGSLKGERFNPSRWIHDSLHPNPLGHEAMAAVLSQWIQQNPDALSTDAMTVGTVTRVAPPDDTRGRELSAVRTWELQQVSDLWWRVLILLVGIAGAWLALVTAYASFRPEPRKVDS